MKRDWDESESVYWRLWARQLVYKNVFGSNYKQQQQQQQQGFDPSSTMQGDYLDKVELTLSAILEAMERRQKMWHGEIPQTEEFIEKPSFGPLIDTVAGMVNSETERAKERHARIGHNAHAGRGGNHMLNQDHGHGHGHGHSHGHQHDTGNGSAPDHFCHQITHNVRKIMAAIAFVMGVPLPET